MTATTLISDRLLVTGASGFIGSHLCRRLCDLGAEVHAISRNDLTEGDSRMRWWRGDLCDSSTVKRVLSEARPEVIFHLAGYPYGAREMQHVIPSFRDNLLSTVNLLSAAAELGCRRLLLSGSMEEPAEHGEVPSSPYAVAKLSCSAYGRMFHLLYQLPVVILRIFMAYGPGQRDLNKLIPYVISTSLRGEPPRLTNGLREIDWIYVGDVVEAFVAAAQAPAVEGETLDIASGRMRTIREMTERIVAITRPGLRPAFGVLPERAAETVHRADIAKSARLTGWRAVVPLDRGLQETIDWYRNRCREVGRA